MFAAAPAANAVEYKLESGVVTTIDFTGFTGGGFTSSPSASQLDSDNWAITGFDDGSLIFGGTRTTGDYARGSVTAAVPTTGGIYAFTSGGASHLLIQPGGDDFTPGTITLRLKNTATTNLTAFKVAYDLLVRNDQGRSNSFNLSWSTDNSTYTSVPSRAFTSVAAADANGLVVVTNPATSTFFEVSGLAVAPDSFIYIRWSGDDAGGTGSRDEFALDNIQVDPTFAVGGGGNSISLTTLAAEYVQLFNTLPSSGSNYSTSLPAGWTYVEGSKVPPNWTYSTTTGASLDTNYGTFSVGETSNIERAFGQVSSNTTDPEALPKSVGAHFVNNTAATIQKLEITYAGEQWRVGGSGTKDRIAFQYSTDAISLSTGTWTNVTALEFESLVTTGGPGLDGNATANRATKTHTIGGLSIAVGASFWIRWQDVDIEGADDLLAIDDFGLTPDVATTSLYVFKDDNLADNDFVVPDEYISYSIAVGHEMDSDLAATNIVVNDLVPTGLLVEVGTPVFLTAPDGALSERELDANDLDGDGAGFFTTVDGTEIRITLGALALGNDWWTVEFDLPVLYRPTAGTITNTARVTSNAPAVTSSVVTNFVACVEPSDCVADSNVCTTTACTLAGSCEEQNNTDSCTDGNNNTIGDQCAGGNCVSGTPCPASSTCANIVGDGTTCVSTPQNEGGDCDDGNAGTEEDACLAGTCVGTPCPTDTLCTLYARDGDCTPSYTTVVCDDENPATANDRCNGAGVCEGNTCPVETECTTYSNDGQCTPIQSTGPCNDGDTGTSNDLCDGAGACEGTPCPIATQCTTYSTDGQCTAIQSTDVCNDGNTGTSNDLCNGAGLCAGTACPTATTCRSYSNDGQCTPTDLPGPCDDGNVNTSGDACSAGTCAGQPCPSATQCTTYSADGQCTAIQSTGSCDDSNTGTSNDLCNGAGLCAGTPCPSATQCTTYSNDGLCTAIQSTGPCVDGNNQTANDTCNAGTCAGTPIVCTPPPTTCQDAVYNGTTCTLTNKAANSVCDDGSNATSNDRCNSGGGCNGTPIVCALPTQCQVSVTANGVDCTVVNKANTETCNDGSLFTGNDRCDGSGTCIGTTIVCAAPTQCETAGVPDGTNCVKGFKGPTVACDDANVATSNDLCNGAGGCAGTPIVCPTPNQCQTAGVPNGTTCSVGNKPNTATCDDGSAATNNDRCDGTGGCAGTTIVCPEPNQCQTAGVPNGTTCVLGNQPNTTTCDDDNDATNNDRCNGNGGCLGTTIVCPADTACGSYEPNGADCTLVPTPGPCDDGDDTTQDDLCVAGECLGTSYECVPSQCELSAVHNGTDCTRTFKADGVLCNDGVNSTRDDVCDGSGDCAGETYSCTPGTCEATSVPDGTGCVATPALPGTACNDADPCTTDDACDGASACAGAAVECGDGEICDPAGTCTITHCVECAGDVDCGEGSNCLTVDATERCLVACEGDDDCGGSQVCRTFGEGMRCFDQSGACAAPVVIPDENPEVTEPTPEETEPQPEVSEPEAEAEVGPELSEPDPEPQVEIAEPTDTSSPDAEAEGIVASGGSGCAGGDASSGLALLLLAALAFSVRRRFA